MPGSEIESEIDVAVEDPRWETVVPDLEAFVIRAVEAGLAIAPDTPGPSDRGERAADHG